ncbi:urea transporter [Streptomyces sp. TLI_171]|uniref:urea transporter n=1 Tax=Streptomyces sp. TLI_171 TaxID=1938859 RepID=UPI000C4402F7|nr:urea transporter [Streptomyces sp. TLI_171]RKE22520.1 urea transporter [Streptomyces sp. TLI_171]
MTDGALGLRRSADRGPLAWPSAVLRGVGQVDLQPHLPTGAVLLAALWLAGWQIGLFATLGTLASTAAAHALGVDRDAVSRGLHGYSGCLTGIAVVTSLGHHPAGYALTVVGGVLCTVLTAALATVLAPFRLTALTAPFCLVTGGTLLAAPAFDRLPHDRVAARPADGAPWHGFFTSVSQVFLLDSWPIGLLMLLGLALAGRRVLVAAALGSAAGTLTAWALGAPTGRIADGSYSCNAVLVAIALGAVFLADSPWSTGFALLGAAASTGLTAALDALVRPFDGRVLTWPFVLTTWALLAAVPHLPRLRHAEG